MGKVRIDLYYKGREQPITFSTDPDSALEAQKVLTERRAETPPVSILMEGNLIVVDEVQHVRVWP